MSAMILCAIAVSEERKRLAKMADDEHIEAVTRFTRVSSPGQYVVFAAGLENAWTCFATTFEQLSKASNVAMAPRLEGLEGQMHYSLETAWYKEITAVLGKTATTTSKAKPAGYEVVNAEPVVSQEAIHMFSLDLNAWPFVPTLHCRTSKAPICSRVKNLAKGRLHRVG
ncbi:hypothetical protein H2198_004687 [Neophaeococcomyces mojaviensis]|uniref:Uncharacterized protein n=1 Tax=Neophaeococcomyces mojaviensis TaxID=3383035 RepID=A0ACC3A872_9EURO|nr:hypothetical protein H2198_004687 [Knufia sp. JES_112]